MSRRGDVRLANYNELHAAVWLTSRWAYHMQSLRLWLNQWSELEVVVKVTPNAGVPPSYSFQLCLPQTTRHDSIIPFNCEGFVDVPYVGACLASHFWPSFSSTWLLQVLGWGAWGGIRLHPVELWLYSPTQGTVSPQTSPISCALAIINNIVACCVGGSKAPPVV